MAHELEELADGRTAFVAAREPGWHRLGYVKADGLLTMDDIMAPDRGALGGWDVRKAAGVAGYVPSGACPECGRKVGQKHKQKSPNTQPCPVPSEDGRDNDDLVVTELDTTDVMDVPGYYTVYRTVPVSGEFQPLGIVGSEYTPVQNEELAELLAAITDQSGAIFETAGSLRGGQDVFITLKLPESIKVGGTDEVDLYLAGMNSHSGRRRLECITTPVRVVCANTERAALANTRSRYTFRHTQGIKDRILEAQQALKLTFDWADVFKAEAESMINAKMSDQGFADLIKTVWPDKWNKPLDEWRKPETTHFDSLRGLFKSADTQENIRGTVWAGYQSIVEYLDWEVPVTGQGEDREAISRIRAARSFDGQYDPLKLEAFKLCRNIVAAA